MRCAITAQLISVLFFFGYKASTISLYLLNPKFQASSHLLLLYSLVCVRPVGKREDRFFRDVAHMQKDFLITQLMMTMYHN